MHGQKPHDLLTRRSVLREQISRTTGPRAVVRGQQSSSSAAAVVTRTPRPGRAPPAPKSTCCAERGTGAGGEHCSPLPATHLAVENDVLAAAQHGLSAHLIAGRLRGEGRSHCGPLEPQAPPPTRHPSASASSTQSPQPPPVPSGFPQPLSVPPHRLDVLGLVVEHLAQLHGGVASARPLPASDTSLPPARRRFRRGRGLWRPGCHGHALPAGGRYGGTGGHGRNGGC